MMREEELLIKQAKVLLSRLERMSADSVWAHKASGLRGSLLRCVKLYEQEYGEELGEKMKALMDVGYEILNKAASEIPDTNS